MSRSSRSLNRLCLNLKRCELQAAQDGRAAEGLSVAVHSKSAQVVLQLQVELLQAAG